MIHLIIRTDLYGDTHFFQYRYSLTLFLPLNIIPLHHKIVDKTISSLCQINQNHQTDLSRPNPPPKIPSKDNLRNHILNTLFVPCLFCVFVSPAIIWCSKTYATVPSAQYQSVLILSITLRGEDCHSL